MLNSPISVSRNSEVLQTLNCVNSPVFTFANVPSSVFFPNPRTARCLFSHCSVSQPCNFQSWETQISSFRILQFLLFPVLQLPHLFIDHVPTSTILQFPIVQLLYPAILRFSMYALLDPSISKHPFFLETVFKLAPFWHCEKSRNHVKNHWNSHFSCFHTPENTPNLETFVDSGGTRNRPDRRASRVLLDFWRHATHAKSQRGSVTPPTSAKIQTPQNRRMYREISTFSVFWYVYFQIRT